MKEQHRPIKNLIIDMDGVLWRGDTPMPGLADFFATLRQLRISFILATNNATLTPDQYVHKLARFGVQLSAGRILNSAEATAAHLAQHYPPGTPILAIGEDGLRQALANHGFTVVHRLSALAATVANGQPQAVVAGLDRHFCYDDLAAAALLVAGGAPFFGTNPDPSLPTEQGLLPGAGAILAAITATTGVRPTIIGKPGRGLYDEALRRLGGVPTDTAAVGDRLDTDIAGGLAAGLRTILLLSGVSRREEIATASVQPDWVFDHLAAFTAALKAGLP
ncbi:MAG: HAD-IIA family hydrolase [Chloroflexi bacterium]|nr:HAD-IIA family hydrolase [Chloroflexota bacterium]MCI0576406.1 HAD-IIA family hydrolase [Chloroflexota bacterium]MCI0644278.1 HAD-IIA family hydrolase [Chloroflexota bacterium]MCI0726261.1 HAD-IIA family hydrolase [Chloroflexota bacterium]